jgi:hypothetical protein
MSEWTQELQDYWKAHCVDNGWKNVPLSVSQDSMKAFIEHIEYLDRLIVAYSLNDAIKIENLKYELSLCKHTSQTMTQLHDEKCNEIEQLQYALAALKEANRWISVEEGLPKENSYEVWKTYLCKLNRYGEIKIAPLWFMDGSWYSEYSGGSRYDNFVTDWRHLPQPPEVKHE